ncbi:hypothetical protein ABWK22_21425, partial [Gottfriedia acidiceleris]|uniref:hypothetical protein n=2 Tax=Bacillaceae TaxID=186817 RepID=UPI0033985549
EQFNQEDIEQELVKEASEILEKEGFNFSIGDIKNLLKSAPNIKEMFINATKTSSSSSQNVYDIIKKTISIYEEELKNNDLTFEQRKELYKLINEQVANSQQQDDKDKTFLGMAYGVTLVALTGVGLKYGPKLVKEVGPKVVKEGPKLLKSILKK